MERKGRRERSKEGWGRSERQKLPLLEGDRKGRDSGWKLKISWPLWTGEEVGLDCLLKGQSRPLQVLLLNNTRTKGDGKEGKTRNLNFLKKIKSHRMPDDG